MYSQRKDTYTCDFCGVEIPWNGSDETHGDMWGCDRCGREFCSRCFQLRHGIVAWDEMMHDTDDTLCPDCYEILHKGGTENE